MNKISKIKNKGMIQFFLVFIILICIVGFLAITFNSKGGLNPLFNPKYLSLDYIFVKIVDIAKAIWKFLTEGPLKEILKRILAIFSVILIVIISYLIIRLNEISKKENKIIKSNVPKNLKSERHNPVWEKIISHVSSENPADWKMAIIEADILLEDVITQMGYQGENLGDKLKKIEQADFPFLQFAWDAHKIRNRIAHEGSAFILTQREAKRVIGLFEMVLRDTGYFSK